MSRSRNKKNNSMELYKIGNTTPNNLWDIFKVVVGRKYLALSDWIKNQKGYKWMTW